MNRKIATFLSLLFLATVASAQTRPTINRVIHNGTRTLTTGDTLDVVLLGDPQGSARFEILGAIRSVQMTETQPGRYEVRYKIPQGLQVERGVVIGYLSRGGLEAAMEASQPVTIKMGQGQSAPTISTSPENGEAVNSTRPEVSASFPVAVKPDSFKFYLDGIDFSRQVQFTENNRKMKWTPGYDLTEAGHKAELRGTDYRGSAVSHSWSFTVGSNNKDLVVRDYLPRQGAEITDSRPAIGALFTRQLEDPKLYVDGRDFTGSAQRSGNKLTWTPTYDLSAGVHEVKVVGGLNGRQVSETWKFTLGESAGTITSVSFSPRTAKVGQRLTVTANAPKNRTLTFDVGNERRNLPMNDSNNSGNYSGTYTLVSGDEGQHIIRCRMKQPNGQTVTTVAEQRLTVESVSLTVDNLQEGAGVPVNFNVQGSGRPGSQVTVVAEYAKSDILGALSGQTRRETFTGTVGPNKRFDVPVQMDLREGTRFKLTVSDDAGSKPLVYNLVRR